MGEALAGIPAKAQSRPDLWLLLSLLSAILLQPILDHGDVRRLILGIDVCACDFVNRQIGTDQGLDMALSSVGLRRTRQWISQRDFAESRPSSNKVGIRGCVLWAQRRRPFFLPEKRSSRHGCAPLYGNQHLSVAWVALVGHLQRY